VAGHLGARAFGIAVADGLVDAAMHLRRLLEVVRALDGHAALFVNERRDHLDEGEENGIAARRSDGAMEADVVDEERLRITQRGKHPGHLLGHRGEAIGEPVLGGEADGADFEDAAGFEDLVAGEAVQRGEEAQRPRAEAGRTAGDEGAGALAGFGDAHRREGVQSSPDGRSAHAELLRELALGGETIARTETPLFDEDGDVSDDGLFSGLDLQRLFLAGHAGSQVVRPILYITIRLSTTGLTNPRCTCFTLGCGATLLCVNWYDLSAISRLMSVILSRGDGEGSVPISDCSGRYGSFASLRMTLVLILFAFAASAEPMLFADYSDPDAIRVGDDYYLVASSFQCVPGLPILHSRDLVDWTLIGYAADRLPPDFDRAQQGNGLWAPSLRHHDGWFWLFVGDPDRGIYLTKAKDARGPWEPLTLVKEAKGWIDPCPFWDDDGSLWLVHAWAKTRAGFQSVLSINRLSDDGRRVVDEGTVVFDGRERQPTIEGPKLYKRNGWYYIFAPAGGVKRGWQTVLRARNLLGPYEDKVVLSQGSTSINGPHQGAWVGDWFVHFQDRGAYGRVLHRQPLTWRNDWPVIGEEGAPTIVRTGFSPSWGGLKPAPTLSLWQWQGNPQAPWLKIDGERLRLKAVPGTRNLQNATNLLLQKLPAPAFTATTRVDAQRLGREARAGLVVMGLDYAALTVEGARLRRITARDGGAEREEAAVPIKGPVYLRVTIAPEAVARFAYATDGKQFTAIGPAFVARPGRWIGAKVGLFAEGEKGDADFDGFRIEPFEPRENASLIVAQDGSGDFRTIQEAVDAIPADNKDDRTILIRNGVYREKVSIEQSHVSLVGEDREKTRIEFAELRKNWRASHPDDWGAAVLNIGPQATDITIANLTVRNDYGKTNGEHDHQFAIRSMVDANRIAVLNANVIADGGDTFSLWNHDTGLSYAADSYFEGWVDFVCPRGWAYITNSRFFGHNDAASIWHDGSRDRDQKLVIRNSHFDGVPGAPLGRNHRDAQFYLLDATLSPNVADRPIYPSPAPDPRQWGERYYYANAHREGGADFAWLADNLATAEGAPRADEVTATWTFAGKWDPATIPAVLPFAAIPNPENGWRFADPAGATLRWTGGRNARAYRVHFADREVREQTEARYETGPLEPNREYAWRVDSVTADGIVEGKQWTFRTDARAVRIALVGDSTMAATTGWGNGFAARLKESAAFLNLGRGGRSTKSYRNEGLWEKALAEKPTHILIQFGHNDQPGKGLDRETDLPTFRANLARYVDEARAIGATPILVTPLTRRNFRDGRIASDLTEHAEATRQVAKEKNVALIDLHAKSIELLDQLGAPISSALGPLKTDATLDKTHLDENGAALFGALMANEVRRTVPELAPHLREGLLPIPQPRWSVRIAESIMKRTPDPLWLDATDAPRWEYTPGLLLKAVMEVAQRTGDDRYWKYVERYYDAMIDDAGNIKGGYKIEEYNIDRINAGKPLFALYERTKKEKYRKAIELLRRQLREHPRTKEGGFWHKKRYPYQMWLDGLYMGAPFLAQYAQTFHEPAAFDDVINQYVYMERHARDEKTGLLYHGWDESHAQKWSDPTTGRSPAFWGRAMGWYAMGLVDTLDFIPLDHPRRSELLAILNRLAEAITKVQDPKTGLWWQVLDQPNREGNYLEASVSTMFADALLKATRLGYLDASYKKAGTKAFDGIIKNLVETNADGTVTLHKVCQVAGLGGDPEKERYRDGTYEYYVRERIRDDDPKGVGPFAFAALEHERARTN